MDVRNFLVSDLLGVEPLVDQVSEGSFDPFMSKSFHFVKRVSLYILSKNILILYRELRL